MGFISSSTVEFKKAKYPKLTMETICANCGTMGWKTMMRKTGRLWVCNSCWKLFKEEIMNQKTDNVTVRKRRFNPSERY